MSEPQSSPVSDSPANRKKARQIPRRVPLSCLPCRRHKLRCDRQTPCTTCSRYHREEQCLLNPAPARGRKNTGVPLTTGTNAGNVATGLNATSEQARTSLPSVSTHQDESAATNVILNGLQQGLPRMSPARRPEGGNEQLDHNIQGLLPVQPHSRPQGESGQLVDNIHMAAAVQSMTTRYHRDTTSSLHYDAAGDLASVNHPPCVLFPQSLPLFQFASLDGSSALDMVVSSDQEVQWKRLLVKFLPTRTQSDILLTYFIEHINWIFQTVHVPTFRKEYSNFWDAEIEEADLIWMSLLFTIISLSALYVPGDIVELVGMQRGSIRQYADTWHRVSRQALQAGGFEEKPTLTQLQTFSVTQLYWIAANNIETLNS